MPGLIWQTRPGVALNFTGVPWAIARGIIHTLNNPHCTPDSVLLLADALAELRRETPDTPGDLERLEHELRALAASFPL